MRDQNVKSACEVKKRIEEIEALRNDTTNAMTDDDKESIVSNFERKSKAFESLPEY